MSDQTLKATRQQSLITLLSKSDWLTTDVLAEKLSVSKETIRRDLKSLQQQILPATRWAGSAKG